MILKEMYPHKAVAVDDPSYVKWEKEERLHEGDQGGLEGNNSRGAEWTLLKIVGEEPDRVDSLGDSFFRNLMKANLEQVRNMPTSLLDSVSGTSSNSSR